MNQAQIIEVQKRIGTAPDGFWGTKSIEAVKRHLMAMMPLDNPWSEGSDASLRRFYGPPDTESNLVVIEFPFPMYYEGKLCKRTRVHRKCADSLVSILHEIGDRYSSQRGVIEEAEDFGGVYNNRPMRGGSRPSVHACGAAIDLNADDNGNLVPWHVKADMPIEVMEVFARHGWTSAGAFWGRYAMHPRATRP